MRKDQSVGGTCSAELQCSVTHVAANAEVFVAGQSRCRACVPHTRITSFSLAALLYVASLARTRGEDRLDYHYEDYAEENGRVHVMTHGVYFDASLLSWMSLKGNYIHDAISGATPLGAPPVPGQDTIAMATIDDIRNAGFIEPQFKLANHTLSPQFAYSLESDYESFGISLNDAIDFNDKNTTLSIGISHAFDHVLPNPGESIGLGEPLTDPLAKDTTDGLLGITQLLGPTTVLQANVMLGYSHGYLSDPYKRVLFDDFPYNPGPDPDNPNPFTVWPEKRPDTKLRETAFVSLNHHFEPVRGAAELTYRFYHDDFGIDSHTVSLQWNQKIGKHVVLSPLVRFYTQTAAYFYATHFPGDPDNQALFPLPKYYSSDYRLSEFDSYTYGLTLSVHVHEHVSLELGYKRYEMHGTDGVTADAQYPKANVFAGGLTLWF